MGGSNSRSSSVNVEQNAEQSRAAVVKRTELSRKDVVQMVGPFRAGLSPRDDILLRKALDDLTENMMDEMELFIEFRDREPISCTPSGCFNLKGEPMSCTPSGCFNSKGEPISCTPSGCFNSKGEPISCTPSGCFNLKGERMSCTPSGCFNSKGEPISCTPSGCFNSKGEPISCTLSGCINSKGKPMSCTPSDHVESNIKTRMHVYYDCEDNLTMKIEHKTFVRKAGHIIKTGLRNLLGLFTKFGGALIGIATLAIQFIPP